jgi:hypothetical protein
MQCCGSKTFWCGSGSGFADPCLCLMDSDPDPDAGPDPPIFVIDFQEANKKLIIFKKFFCLLGKVHLHHFSKIKSQKEVTKQ